MKRFILTFVLGVIVISGCAHNDPKKTGENSLVNNPKVDSPKLVVGLVVDQMRWDYLIRYSDLYCEGGFNRLMRDGYNCNRTNINYIPAITAVGHTSIYTGSVPAITGIVGNHFEKNGAMVYCTEDKSVLGVGSRAKDGSIDPETWAGRESPRNLQVTTITDQLRLATNFRSKVIGVALKDRASILPAGHSANAAYWMDYYSYDFITSTYYMNELPKWVTDFNKRKLGYAYEKNLAAHNKDIKGGPWELLIDEAKYVQSAPRGQRWEDNLDGSIKQSPWGATITFDMAKAAVEGENLGNNPEGVPDFLAVSISSTDLLGHKLSPNSIWIEDTYLRLDRDIADFLSYLDQKVGKGNYLFFLSADHGGSHNVEFRRDHHLPADTWEFERIKEELNNHLKEKFPQFGTIVMDMGNMQVHFTKEVRQSDKLNSVTNEAIRYLRNMDEVAYAFSFMSVPDYVPEPIRTMAINGYCPKRSGDICIVFQPRMIEDYASLDELKKPDHIYKGTTHSLWNPDDTHIPLIFMGWNVPQAWDNEPHQIVDITATLAALLNIQQPSGCIGKSVLK